MLMRGVSVLGVRSFKLYGFLFVETTAPTRIMRNKIVTAYNNSYDTITQHNTHSNTGIYGKLIIYCLRLEVYFIIFSERREDASSVVKGKRSFSFLLRDSIKVHSYLCTIYFFVREPF